jgi:hypothetical protein
MKKKRAKRKVVSLDAEFSLDGKNYKGLVDNVSDGGLRIRASATKTAICTVPGAPLELKLRQPLGKKINLNCEIIWFHVNKKPSEGIITTIGTKVIAPPEEYKTFVKSLY